MSHKFIEVITEYPTTEEVYKLLLQIEHIVQIRPEAEAVNEPHHEPAAIVTLATGETLTLKNSYKSVVQELDEVNMIVRP